MRTAEEDGRVRFSSLRAIEREVLPLLHGNLSQPKKPSPARPRGCCVPLMVLFRVGRRRLGRRVVSFAITEVV
jgi:hypothetical protein